MRIKLTAKSLKFFPRAEHILNQKDENVSHVGKVTFLEKKQITKLDIKSIDGNLKKGETPKNRMLFTGGKNKLFKEKT